MTITKTIAEVRRLATILENATNVFDVNPNVWLVDAMDYDKHCRTAAPALADALEKLVAGIVKGWKCDICEGNGIVVRLGCAIYPKCLDCHGTWHPPRRHGPACIDRRDA